ncbi:stress responsive protein [Adhaeribacter aerolatus]|uniref:Stress responsive protein n=1 Tax=Adhaeribacter aerolatus TaxID=670289 RepID=A0A512AWA8_9BACT|nr:Dabb family protein [Adhaeribacter aerolatus]GEO04008.1 stress responsive protein [Adhaeribacter aerolatus]
MKNNRFIILIILLICLGTGFYLKANTPKEKKLRHVVAFKFKPGTTTAQMQKATVDFLNLKKLVPQITELEGGPDISFEKKNGKFTHCFVVSVKSKADLDAYGAHPNHKAFSRSVDPLLAEVMVVDYWTE